MILVLLTTTIIGGGEIALIDWLKNERRDFIVVVPNFGPIVNRFVEFNIPYTILDKRHISDIEISRRFGYLKFFAAIPRLIYTIISLNMFVFRNNPKVIVTNDIKALLVSSFMLPFSLRRYHNLHELLSDDYGSGFFGLIKWAINRVDFLVCNSFSTYDSVKQLGCSSPKTTVLYQYFDCFDRRSFRSSKSDTVIIGSAARINRLKRIDLPIRAISELSKFYNLKFVIYGIPSSKDDHVYLSELQQLVEELKMTDLVIFAGFEEQQNQIFESIDIFVSSSALESFGRVVAESLSCGCCTVASDLQAHTELIVDGWNGFLFKRNDYNDLVRVLKIALYRYSETTLAFNAQDSIRQKLSRSEFIEKIKNLYC